MKKLFAVVLVIAVAGVGACGGKNKNKASGPDNKGGAAGSGSAMGGAGYGGAGYGGATKPEAGGGGY